MELFPESESAPDAGLFNGSIHLEAFSPTQASHIPPGHRDVRLVDSPVINLLCLGLIYPGAALNKNGEQTELEKGQ